MRKVVGLAIAAGILLVTAPANATPLNFTISGTDNISWTLDSNPTPDYQGRYPSPVNGWFTTQFFNIAGQYNGSDAFLILYFMRAAAQAAALG